MRFKDFLAIVEIRTKIVSLTSFGLGVLFAATRARSFSWPVTLLMLAAVLCVDMGTTAFNTFFDYERRVDSPEHNREPDKVLVHGGVAPGAALLVALALFALAAALGIALAALRGLTVIVWGAAGMAVGYFYNGGKHPISRTPIGELFAGGFLGSILFLLTWYVEAGPLPAEAWLAALPLFLLVASILTTNNTCDVEGDRVAGRRTLSIVVGRKHGEALVYAQGALAYGVTALEIVLRILPGYAAAPLAISLGLTVASYRDMHRGGFSHEAKGRCMRSITRVLAFYGVAVALSLGAAILLRGLPLMPEAALAPSR